MSQAIARVIGKDQDSSFTNSWYLMLLIENEDGTLSDDRTQRVELKDKDQSYHYSEGDIINLKQFKDWGWAVGMMKATSTKSRKYN